MLLPQFERLFVVAFGPLLLLTGAVLAWRAWKRMKDKGASI